MASIQYVVSATDAASRVFAKIAASADGLDKQLADLSKRVATPEVDLKDAKFTLGMVNAAKRLDKLSAMVADPEVDVDAAKAQTEILRITAMLDRLDAKKVTAEVKVKVDESALSKLSKLGALQPSLMGTAVALSPALIPLSASIAAGIGAIAVSFGAATIGAGVFGLAAASVLSAASQNLKKLQTLEANVNKATTAAQKKSAAAALAALKATFAPGYMALLDQLDKFKAAWTKTSQTIAVPALSSWLGALTKGMPLLVTAVKPVADVFKNFGDILRVDFADPAVMRNLQGMAAAFGKFAAGQLNLIGRAIGDIALGVYHLGKDFASSGANFASAGVWFANIGAGFLTWSKSKKARDDVDGFMKFLRDNGPTVKNILKDLGTILPGVFKGATTAGTLELQAISGFLGLVAKLPKGWQAPLTEAAGAMLLLSKTGVVKVGLQLTGWSLAGRAAGGAAEGAGAGGALAALQKSTGLKWVFRAGAAVAIAELIVKPALQSTSSGKGKNWWDNPFGTDKGKGALNSWKDLWHDIEHIFDVGRHFISHIWDVIWNNTVGRVERGRHDIAAEFDTWRHNISDTFDRIRHGIATAWDTIWRNTVSRVRNGIGDVIHWTGTLPGRLMNGLMGLGTTLWNFGHMIFSKFWNGLKSAWNGIASWLGKIGGWIKNLKGPLGKDLNLLYDEGRAIMHGLGRGIKHGFSSYVSKTLGNVGSGVQQWAGLVRKALAMEGLSPMLAGNVLYQMQTESGGRVNAINLNDINAQMGDPSRGLMQVIGSTFAAYHWPGTSWNIYDPLANIAAALNYARHRYGPTLMSGGMGIGSGHGYAAGSWNVPYTGPAVVHQGEMIIPAARAAAIRAAPLGPGRGGEQRIVIEFAGGGEGKLVSALLETLRRQVRIQGGDVQRVLGRN